MPAALRPPPPRPYLLPIRIGTLLFRDERNMTEDEALEGHRVFRKIFNFYHDRVAETIGEDPGCGVRDEVWREAHEKYRLAGGGEDRSAYRMRRETERKSRDRVTDNNFAMYAYEDGQPVGGALFHAVKIMNRVGANVDYRSFVTVLTRPDGLGAGLLRWLLDNRHDARRDDGTLMSMNLRVLDFPVNDVRNRWRSDLPHARRYMKDLGTYVEWDETPEYRYPLWAMRR